jgi:uncharacterized protein
MLKMPAHKDAVLLHRLLRWGLIAFIGLNGMAATVAYTLTHSRPSGRWGLGISRPINTKVPADVGLPYQTQHIPINAQAWLETWHIPAQSGKSQGTVLVFPGSGSSKGSQLLAPAKVFHSLNYDILLVDYQGVGGSSGSSRTIGMKEAQDVATAFKYAQRSNNRPLILYGISMGSAAVLRAIAKEQVKPDAVILESPYGRFLDTVKSRFRVFKIPDLGAAELLVFWGGLQHGVDGFTHNPETFAQSVTCPTLVFQGGKDQWTTVAEVERLVKNLRGPKELVVFPTAGHQLLVTVDKSLWQQSVASLLSQNSVSVAIR